MRTSKPVRAPTGPTLRKPVLWMWLRSSTDGLRSCSVAFTFNLAQEGVLAAHLLNRDPRIAHTFILTREITRVANLLEHGHDLLPRDLVIVQLLVDVVELGLDEGHVTDHLGQML